MRILVSLWLTIVMSLAAASTASAAQAVDPPTAAMTVAMSTTTYDLDVGSRGPWYPIPVTVKNTGTVPITVTSLAGREGYGLVVDCRWRTPVLQPGEAYTCRLPFSLDPPLKAGETRPFTVSATATSDAGAITAETTGAWRARDTDSRAPSLGSFNYYTSQSEVYPGQATSFSIWPIGSMTAGQIPPTRWTSLVSSTYGNILDPNNPLITSTTCTADRVTLCSFTAPAIGAAGTTVTDTVTAVGANAYGETTFTASLKLTIRQPARGDAKYWRDAVPTWPTVSFLTPWTPTTEAFGGSAVCDSQLSEQVQDTLYETLDKGISRGCRPHLRLVRQATVAVLNEASLGADFPAESVDRIRADVQEALSSGKARRITDLTATYTAWNAG